MVPGFFWLAYFTRHDGLRSVHVVMNGPFRLFLWLSDSIVYTDQQSVSGHFGRFHDFTAVNSAGSLPIFFFHVGRFPGWETKGSRPGRPLPYLTPSPSPSLCLHLSLILCLASHPLRPVPLSEGCVRGYLSIGRLMVHL